MISHETNKQDSLIKNGRRDLLETKVLFPEVVTGELQHEREAPGRGQGSRCSAVTGKTPRSGELRGSRNQQNASGQDGKSKWGGRGTNAGSVCEHLDGPSKELVLQSSEEAPEDARQQNGMRCFSCFDDHLRCRAECVAHRRQEEVQGRDHCGDPGKR